MNGKRATRFNGRALTALSVLVISLVSSINLLVLPASSYAAEPPPGPTPAQRAKQHYLKAESYFKAHDFSAAMGEYQSGYEERPDPVFIFNIAQCQRLLGHPVPALQSYRRYLREAPEGAGRAVAERQIDELERLTGGEGATEPTTPGPPSPTGATVAGGPASVDAPVVAPEGPAVEAQKVPSTTSSPPSAAGRDPFPAPPSSGAASKPPAATTRSLAAVDTTSPPVAASPALVSRSEEESARPIYRRWWFWVAAGAVSLATIVAVSVASSGGKPACDPDRVCR